MNSSNHKHELDVIRRYRFGQKSEQYSGVQGWLFEEDAQADLVAIESELDALNKTAAPKTKAPARPKRHALPPELPRVEIYHEPEDLHISSQVRRSLTPLSSAKEVCPCRHHFTPVHAGRLGGSMRL